MGEIKNWFGEIIYDESRSLIFNAYVAFQLQFKMKVVFQQLLIYYKQIYFLDTLSRKLKGGIRQINVTKSCTVFRNCNWNMGKIYSYIFILIIYDLTLLFEMFWNNILMSPPSFESHRHAWMRLSMDVSIDGQRTLFHFFISETSRDIKKMS